MLGDMERPQHVDRHDLREDVLRVVLDGRDRPEHARVGERDVEAAELRDAQLDRRAHRRRVRDVGHAGDRAGTEIRNRLNIADDHARALGEEQPRRRRPDRTGPAGDQRHLARQPIHARHPSREKFKRFAVNCAP
jgi:hypothetical protein